MRDLLAATQVDGVLEKIGVLDRHNKITPGSQIAPPQIQIAPLAVTRAVTQECGPNW